MTAQVAAVRSSSRRLLEELQRGLSGYRIVLLSPTAAKTVAPPANIRKAAARARTPEPKPLAVPDPRLLQRLDTRIQDFVRENPAIEGIITREIVRDVDSKVLDARRLLEKSSLEIAFDLDLAGAIGRPRITLSSRVPSIDHLGLETARLLEKYQLLAAFRGCRRVSFSIEVEDQIVVRLEGEVADPAALEEVSRSMRDTLTLMRFALATSSAAFTLEEVTIEAKETHIALIRAFDKQSLIGYLMKYTQAQADK